MTDDSVFYKVVLIAPNGEEVITKKLRIHPLLRKENEMSGHMRGIELARDAMFHAGFWEKAREAEIEEQRARLTKQIEEIQEQVMRLEERLGGVAA